jgi:SAM-dependent methyltransferase
MRPSPSFRIVAIIAARNEGDILGQVIDDLIRQQIDVYLIDDGSTDDTAQIGDDRLGRGVIGVEHRAASTTFEWTEILRRKEALAAELDARWFIHHDADEFREGPWSHLDLKQSIQQIDGLGFTAIDFRVLNFRPTTEILPPCTDIRLSMPLYEEADPVDRLQIKCWRKPDAPIDLASSGGHEAVFQGRIVFPTRFLVRHYPIRGRDHGGRKVVGDRLPRFGTTERNKGWHVQYDLLARSQDFVWDAAQLQKYDADQVRRELLETSRDADDRLAHRLAEAEIELRALRATRDQLSANCERLLVERADTARRFAIDRQTQLDTIGRLKDDCAGLSRELQAVHASRSWALTAPLRAAYSLVAKSEPADPAALSRPNDPASRTTWGELDRRTPVSQSWGLDRGLPVDRYFIQAFLSRHAEDVRGRVLEVKDPGYARMYGTEMDSVSVVDIDRFNPHVTLVADLAEPESLPIGEFDCFICTQTLHIIYDIRAALRNAMRCLRPGGVLLCTLPAVSRVNEENGSADFWRFTRAAVERLWAEQAEATEVTIWTVGNVKTCAAFLYGLATEDLDAADLAYHDPWFPLLHSVRAVRR